jgi:hypothetical protein
MMLGGTRKTQAHRKEIDVQERVKSNAPVRTGIDLSGEEGFRNDRMTLSGVVSLSFSLPFSLCGVVIALIVWLIFMFLPVSVS